jgi:hypothetical protein
MRVMGSIAILAIDKPPYSSLRVVAPWRDKYCEQDAVQLHPKQFLH